jgi:hypothetical protein
MVDRQPFQTRGSALGNGREEPKTTPIFWLATFSRRTKKSLSERTFAAFLPTNWWMESLLLQFQDFGVRVHVKIGDYLREFDPALTDTIPAPDWIFGDESELHGLELPTNVIKGEDGFHRSEPYEQWPTAMILVERGGPPVRQPSLVARKTATGTLFERYHSNASLDTATMRFDMNVVQW